MSSERYDPLMLENVVVPVLVGVFSSRRTMPPRALTQFDPLYCIWSRVVRLVNDTSLSPARVAEPPAGIVPQEMTPPASVWSILEATEASRVGVPDAPPM